MKDKINIFSDKKIKFFLNELLSDYILNFVDFNKLNEKLDDSSTNIIFLNDIKNINLKNLNDNCLIFSDLKNEISNLTCKSIHIPAPVNYIKNSVKNFFQNLKIQFHDISIANEKLTNIKNNSFCYLTKLESEILSHLIIEKESTKNFIKENILNIKSTIRTNSLESHLTRIRKKMNQINTTVKIQSRNEKLLIII